MRTIYLDSEFQCHIANDGTMTAVETDFFDGKCDAFVEGYRLVPDGAVWEREGGEVFMGQMIAPVVDYAQLDDAQRQYEQEQIAQYESALAEIEKALGV